MKIIYNAIMQLPNLVDYSLFLFINFIFILFVLRAFYFALIAKIDPIKTIIPKIIGWKKINEKEDIMREVGLRS